MRLDLGAQLSKSMKSRSASAATRRGRALRRSTWARPARAMLRRVAGDEGPRDVAELKPVV